MELKLEKENFSMSPNVLKEELTDLKQIFMIYDKSNIKTKISNSDFLKVIKFGA